MYSKGKRQERWQSGLLGAEARPPSTLGVSCHISCLCPVALPVPLTVKCILEDCTLSSCQGCVSTVLSYWYRTRVPDFARDLPWPGVQLLLLQDKRWGWAAAVLFEERAWGSSLPVRTGLCIPANTRSSNWNLVLPELPKPSPGTSRGQPARNLGRGSRNSWSQQCTNGQEARGGPHSLGFLPGEVAELSGASTWPASEATKASAARDPAFTCSPF